MATAGSAERPGTPGSAAGSSASSPPEDEARCPVCAAEAQPGKPPCGHPACPLCLARRLSGGGGGGRERLRRRSHPERSSSRPGRRDCDSRREVFIAPAQISKCGDGAGKQKLLATEDREEARRRNCKDECVSLRHYEDPGVLSDSENEEPPGRRTRNFSAFVRRTRPTASCSRGAQRSQSCSDSVEERGGKLKLSQPAAVDKAGIGHSFTAGILLSSENSRSVSAPVTLPDRRLSWRAVMTSSTPLGVPQARQERSISPESNDSISEELNHFKPIVCSPCTPPKRLPDGRVMEPTIVKSTPRNLTRGLQRATSYEASPAVLQKWRQIELDRQSVKVDSKATLTSPVGELHARSSKAEEAAERRANSGSPAGRDGGRAFGLNKRRLVFDRPAAESDGLQKQAVKIRVPAVRLSGEAALRGSSEFEPAVAPESCSGAVFSKRRSFSPYARNSCFQSCRFVSKDAQSPRKEADGGGGCGCQNQTTSRRGKKRSQKTKHLEDAEPEPKRSRPLSRDALEVEALRGGERRVQRVQQEREDRALAVRLQRQFDLESQRAGRPRRSPDKYFLRSWMSNQNRRRRSPRKSRRISKKR
ncbi:E3 ubiquitin-protein ligase RNF169 [Myripristis murdjan]|uniref:RING-type E3 ubiquitin transferase n=1 Tax=Myripristis murdjan TaxID=586833 RepID=A0A667Y0V0_9TELE|nr:E3 ubiquitin-protein ligase RNF169 [Myripristis murdjan]